MKKILNIIVILTFLALQVSAQEIRINVNNRHLNKVLVDLRDAYKINLSFNDKELSKYSVSLQQNFSSPDEAFKALTKDLPVTFEKSNDVYLFYTKREVKTTSIKKFRISGKIIDEKTRENLPFTNILINGKGTTTDNFGNFSYETKTDSIFHLKVLYLGYHQLDTVLPAGANYIIELKAMTTDLKEVVIEGSPVVFSEQTGTKAGLMRINHKIARFIPGNGDNSVFNLLRLQPGVLAAGEQSNQMIVWGSYEGQSQISFDEITLFGLKNYNENISNVNPYMAKDIRINKGGYDATLGERVGGIIDITGIDGNKKKPALDLSINNTTLNIKAETPIGKHLSVVGAFRQSYFNMYDAQDMSSTQSSMSHMEGNNILVKPDYTFRDANFKLSGQANNGDYYALSTLWGQDRFYYNVKEEIDEPYYKASISQELEEKKNRYGGSILYNKVWKDIGSGQIKLSYSQWQSETKDVQNSSEINMGMDNDMHNENKSINNDMSEFKAILSNKLSVLPNQELEFALAYIQNIAFLEEISLTNDDFNSLKTGDQIMSYIQNKYLLNKYLNINLGLRNDYALNLNENYLQPRISLAVKPTSNIQFNLSWGIYNQFVSLVSDVDENNNYRYLWMISDNDKVSVLTAQHYVFGGVYHKNGFSLSIESFYKQTNGITRILTSSTSRQTYTGKSKAMGLDFFIKQEYKGHSAWISYSLSQVSEWFPYFENELYRPAVHDQRHELKIASIINLSPFYISANYVYGSGFEAGKKLTGGSLYPYQRFDIAAIYRFKLKKIKLEAGLSFLNVFNYENIKYADIVQIPTENKNTVGLYSEAIPFTPGIFLNISL